MRPTGKRPARPAFEETGDNGALGQRDKHYAVLLECIRDTEAMHTVLDVGCRSSPLYDYIRKNDLKFIEYSGLEPSAPLRELAQQKFPGLRYYDADILNSAAEPLPAFDYVFLDRAFHGKGNRSHAQMLDYLRDVVLAVFELATVGFAFNLRTVPSENEDLLHLPIAELTDFLQRTVGPFIVVRHDYDGDESTAYVYKAAAAAERPRLAVSPAPEPKRGAPRFGDIAERFGLTQSVMDAARSKAELDPTLLESFEAYRASDAYREVFEKKEPLVSICVVTYNRAPLLTGRALPSILSQDYANLEIIVVGDGCTDDTGDAIARLNDRRIRFENIPRSQYPQHPALYWLAAGGVPATRALELVTGDLVTHLDDDDEFMPHRISKLVTFLQTNRAEFVWHPFWLETGPDRWVHWPAAQLEAGQLTTGSVMYLGWFKRLPVDTKAYLYPEPGDWNRFRKLKYIAGSRVARYPEALLRHYQQRIDRDRGLQNPDGSGDNGQ